MYLYAFTYTMHLYSVYHNYTFWNVKEHFYKVLAKTIMAIRSKPYKSVRLHYKTFNGTKRISAFKCIYSEAPNSERLNTQKAEI